MAAIDSVLSKIRNLINRANSTTGRTDADLTNAVDALIDGYGKGGVTPSGTKTITANGNYDVTEYAQANVNVPASGVTPSGTKTITANGTHDVTSYASADVAIPQGMNARVFTTTVASDVTSGNFTIFPANEYLKSIRSDPDAFVLMIPMAQKPSTAMYSLWINANFTLAYTGATARNTILIRTSASANNVTANVNGLPGENYGGHMSVESNGSIMIRGCNTTYPVRAGEYLIIAGLKEML